MNISLSLHSTNGYISSVEHPTLFLKNIFLYKKRPYRPIPIGRYLYLILNFPHMFRVGIMHSQLHNYLHCLKCNLFICLSTHYAGLALISTKKSFQQFRIHSSPKHVQRIKTRKKAFEHCVFFICNIQSFLLFLKVHDTPLI